MEESPAHQLILPRGLARGRDSILFFGEAEFEAPPAPATRAALEATDDVDRLRRLGTALPRPSSWSDLRAAG